VFYKSTLPVRDPEDMKALGNVIDTRSGWIPLGLNRRRLTMAKPGYTDTRSHAAERTKIRDAGEMAEQVANGKILSPEATTRARDAFVELLWTDAAGAETTARTGIVALYSRLPTPSMRPQSSAIWSRPERGQPRSLMRSCEQNPRAR